LEAALSNLHRFEDASEARQVASVPSRTSTRGSLQSGEAAAAARASAAKGKGAEVLEGTKAQLRERLEMAAAIMRKLYVRSVELEKELALLRTSPGGGGVVGSEQGRFGAADEHDAAAIEQLHAALASAQRQVAVLKGAVGQQSGGGAQASHPLLAEVAAHAAMHEDACKRIRRDYHRLLNK